MIFGESGLKDLYRKAVWGPLREGLEAAPPLWEVAVVRGMGRTAAIGLPAKVARAAALLDQEQGEKSVMACEELASLAGDDPRVQLLVARLQLGLRDRVAARTALDRALALTEGHPYPLLLHTRIACLVALGDDDAVLPDCERTLQLLPEDGMALLYRGLIRHRRRDDVGAAEDWARAVQTLSGEALADRLRAFEPVAREAHSPMTSFDQLPKDLPPQLRAGIEKGYRLGPMVVLKNESFSPAISGEWAWKTIQAVLWAFAAILLYVMFRFTMSFSVGGIVALIHDIFMAMGLFVLFGFEFSVPVVASFLILIGYSMADTIVVFDRIRENMHKPEYRRSTITKLVNDSINQTLSRTILTSLSVLFVAFCLFAWGGPALRDLAFPIFVGVITGTYSSIYIASPVVVYWDRWFGGRDKLKQHD